jgi:NADH-quinone oxidoreductase subunit J
MRASTAYFVGAGTIVAAIAITLRTRKETKYQHPSEQLSVRASDRLKIVKMAPEGVGPPPRPAPEGKAGA